MKIYGSWDLFIKPTFTNGKSEGYFLNDMHSAVSHMVNGTRDSRAYSISQ